MEASPVLEQNASDFEVSNASPKENNGERHVSKRYLFCLSCGFSGLQVIWSVILANGTPFLISLGLSKSVTSLVWTAAPIAGTFVQPIIGIQSDRCRASWGRRRPFIVFGAIATVCSLTALAWVEGVASLSIAYSGTEIKINKADEQQLVMVLASIFVCCLNIAIQPIQVGMRALLIENAPKSQQARATAWSTYMIGIGNIAGYLLGSIDLVGDYGLGHASQFRVLACIASGVLLATTLITCASIDESLSTESVDSSASTPKIWSMLSSARKLPRGITDVYKIQFFAWIGWFPMLYYKSTYVSEIYTESTLHRSLKLGATPGKLLEVKAAHVGTMANLLFAVVALGSNIVFSAMNKRRTFRNASPGSDLARLWLVGHLLLVHVVLLTCFVTSAPQATVLLAVAGISWSLTQWLPYVALGEEIISLAEKESGKPKGNVGVGVGVEAGTIMSLHNAAISLPQILAAGLCSAIFWVAEDSDKSWTTALAMRIAGMGTAVAAYFTSRLYT